MSHAHSAHAATAAGVAAAVGCHSGGARAQCSNSRAARCTLDRESKFKAVPQIMLAQR
jgi:hypothetical protein